MQKRWRSAVVSGTYVAVLAVAPVGMAPGLTAAPEPLSAAAEQRIPEALPDSDLSPAEARDLRELFREARRVLLSPQFEANLAAATAGLDLHLEPNGEAIRSTELARLLRGDLPGFTYVQAKTKWRTFGGSVTEGSGEAGFGAVIKVKKAVRGLWRAPAAASRSCAINTAAHELTHTVTAKPGRVDFTIADRGYQNAPSTQHFASYTVGSVAQCTWLDQQGALPGTIAECVAANGTREYSPPDC